MPLFSVIIPTRDRPQFLEAAIRSVLGQSMADFELLIVNDGESEVTIAPDKRICVLNNHMHGAVAARDLGIASAKGNFIAFLDDDDMWTDISHLGQALSALNGDAGFYFANGMLLYPNQERRSFARDASAASLAHDNTILISTVCYRKSLHDKLGMFDKSLPYYWDWDWYLRVARAGVQLQHNPISAVDIRVHAQNMSGNDNIAARQANLNLLCDKHDLGKITLKNHADFAS
jgi:glycosyltransferase involved in cell wall biosynthesis